VSTGSELKSDQQITDANRHLANLKVKGIDRVTKIRVEASLKEKDRLELEEQFKVRDIKKETPAKRINLFYRDVEQYWKSLLKIDDSIELHDSIEAIKEQYDWLFKSESDAIDGLRSKLRDKDKIFLKGLSQQWEMLDDLRTYVRDETEYIQHASEEALKVIQESFSRDRSLSIRKRAFELDELSRTEEQWMKQHLNSIDDLKRESQNRITKVQDDVIKDYIDLHNKLTKASRKLECELESSKSKHKANIDQIEYKHILMANKNEESEERIKRRKKRAIAFKTELNKVIENYGFHYALDKKKINSLEVDCRRLEGQYDNLQQKLHRFELQEEQKFIAALTMHQEEVNVILKEIETTKKSIFDMFNM
jgi:hypothetical protein